MNALYNLIYGRKNSFYKNSDVADEADHVDENGFVLVNSEELQERCTEVFFNMLPFLYLYYMQ